MAEDRSPKKDLQSSETSGRTGKRRLRIGNVELDNNLVLAPMAGVTDLPFRILCKEQGCGLLCTEMVMNATCGWISGRMFRRVR